MRIDHPPVATRTFDSPEDELDRLLRSFLRAELPDPWPPFRFPEPQAALPRRAARWSWRGSRFALAATVAFCLVGSLVVGGFFPGAERPALTTEGLSAPISSRESIGVTPKGHRVKISEEQKGNTTSIRIEWIDPPALDD